MSMARHGKSSNKSGQEMFREPKRSSQPRVKQIWKRRELPQQNKVVINQGSKVEAYRIVGNTNTEAEEWLQRSIVCESEEPIEVHTLYEALIIKAGMQVIIRAMSFYKFIITFQSSMLMEGSLKAHGVLDDWFTYGKWRKSEQAEIRQVWLAVYGVPVHGWTEVNFQEIAKVWGRLVHLEQGTNNTMNFE